MPPAEGPGAGSPGRGVKGRARCRRGLGPAGGRAVSAAGDRPCPRPGRRLCPSGGAGGHCWGLSGRLQVHLPDHGRHQQRARDGGHDRGQGVRPGGGGGSAALPPPCNKTSLPARLRLRLRLGPAGPRRQRPGVGGAGALPGLGPGIAEGGGGAVPPRRPGACAMALGHRPGREGRSRRVTRSLSNTERAPGREVPLRVTVSLVIG